MSEFDYRKPVQTKSGQNARLIDETARGDHPLTYLVRSRTCDIEDPLAYDKSGKCSCGAAGQYDLVNIPETYECWVVFPKKGFSAPVLCLNEKSLGGWKKQWGDKITAIKKVTVKKGEME